MIRQGDTGEAVVRLQRYLGALGYQVAPDGALGPRTMGALQTWLEGETVPEIPTWLFLAVEKAALSQRAPVRATNSGSPFRIGAWFGNWAIANPKDAVALARDVGFDRADIICNDHAAWRKPAEFTIRDPHKIARLASYAHTHGFEVHLMSWVMTHREYIVGAAQMLLGLAKDCGAASIQFDAEEPWTKAKKHMGYPEAAKLIAELFADRPCDLGVSGIKWTPDDAFRPIASVCDYYLPQAYATQTTSDKWGVKPETVVPSVVKRYRTEFGLDKRLVVGLACYRQSGIKGHSIESALRTCYESALNVGAEAIVYWQLRHLRKAREVRRVLAALR